MTVTGNFRILCVDDEPEVLQGLRLHLARHYDVRTATGGPAALAQLREDPGVAAIISDMRMPGMNGAEFLARSIEIAPAALRILLTGQADLSSAIAAVNDGQIFRFLTKPCAPPDLLRAVGEAVERFRAKDLERTATRRRIEAQQLSLDPLTGLGSRQSLMAALEAAAYDASDADCTRTAYFVEIETSGEAPGEGEEPWGDVVAKAVAERLREFWPADTKLVRWGPEQFVALLPSEELGDGELQTRGAELLRALTSNMPIEGQRVTLGASIGIARLTDRLYWRRLVQQAATAAREARKHSGVYLYQGDASAVGSQRALVHELRKALEHGGLSLAFQPIVDIVNGRVHGLEALIRWKHHTLGDIAPDIFIPRIEESGDIIALGQWVLRTACREARPLISDERLVLSVNVSPRQMLDASFLPHLEDCLTRSGMPLGGLQLELTETALASDVERLSSIMDRVRRLDVRIAVDDFGTGYSSLSYLHRLPIDTIKVDGSFVQDLQHSGKTIIRAAMAVARDFGQEVVIEGVETDAMLQGVSELGASLVQGFYFSKPMPLAQVPAWLRSFSLAPRSR